MRLMLLALSCGVDGAMCNVLSMRNAASTASTIVWDLHGSVLSSAHRVPGTGRGLLVRPDSGGGLRVVADGSTHEVHQTMAMPVEAGLLPPTVQVR
jgi:hypothetical protein